MTKIDPTPLIAEAQARETALKKALEVIEAARMEVYFWRVVALACFAWAVLA